MRSELEYQPVSVPSRAVASRKLSWLGKQRTTKKLAARDAGQAGHTEGVKAHLLHMKGGNEGGQNTPNTGAGIPALTLPVKSWKPQPVQPVSFFKS